VKERAAETEKDTANAVKAKAEKAPAPV